MAKIFKFFGIQPYFWRYSNGPKVDRPELGRFFVFFDFFCIRLYTWPAKGWPILRIWAILKTINLWPTTVPKRPNYISGHFSIIILQINDWWFIRVQAHLFKDNENWRFWTPWHPNRTLSLFNDTMPLLTYCIRYTVYQSMFYTTTINVYKLK